MAAARVLRCVCSKWLVVCSVLGGSGAAAIASTDDPATTLKICTSVPLCLLRNAFTASIIVFDYQYSLWGLPDGSKERAEAKHEAHVRCAHRLRDLCFQNGGIYIKLGQHIGQLTKEYNLTPLPKEEGNPDVKGQGTFKVLLAFSVLKHALASNRGYNLCVSECREAAKVLLE